MVVFLGFIGKGVGKLLKIKPLKALGKLASGVTGISIHTTKGQLPTVAASPGASQAAQDVAGGVTYAEQQYALRRSLGAKPGPALVGALGSTADMYGGASTVGDFVQKNTGLIMLGLVGLVLVLVVRKR